MKKALALIMTFVLAFTALGAFAEANENIFDTLSALDWEFASGVGAWGTELRISADGSFTGSFHDSEMGETGDGYPDGTVYGCSFSGRMSFVERIDENTVKLHVDALSLDEGQVDEAIEDNIRFVTTDPYGVSEGDDMLLYAPGTPMDAIPEDMVIWTHLFDTDGGDALENWFLTSEANESGFVGFEAFTDSSAGMENPWADMTADELMEAAGVAFGVPEGADNVIYRYCANEQTAEMQFTLDGDEYIARIKPSALEYGQLENISGMYFGWENEIEVDIKGCYGTLGQAQTGTEEFVELCLWYDFVPGLMYSLSVYTTDLDGLDLTAVAEQVYVPMQGDAE